MAGLLIDCGQKPGISLKRLALHLYPCGTKCLSLLEDAEAHKWERFMLVESSVVISQ